MSKETVDVSTGEVKLGPSGTVLRSVAIGSCVAIAAWDGNNTYGAMAHVMLPAASAGSKGHGPRNCYAHDAVDAVLEGMKRAGSTTADIRVCLAGGANVLGRPDDRIGQHNLESIAGLLHQRGVLVVAESVGGTERRTLSLDVETGIVTCAVGDAQERMLWCGREAAAESSRLTIATAAIVDESTEPPTTQCDRERINELEGQQRACINLMQDLEDRQRQLELAQHAYLNLMQDLALAKKKADDLNARLEYRVQEVTRELKESAIQLFQVEKLSALGELAASVAHELNQPLNAVKIITQSLLRDWSRGEIDRDAASGDLRDIVTQVDKMAAIISHMKMFSRDTSGDAFQTIAINSLVEGALRFLKKQFGSHGIVLSIESGEALPNVSGDPVRLEQVILNLMTNARDALEGRDSKRISIRTCRSGERGVAIEVGDNGHGIPDDTRQKIFNPFFSTKAAGRGTGLGLSVAHKIIQEHKGKIEVESKVGVGTLFRIILPETGAAV